MKLPRVEAKDVIKVLKNIGFSLSRQSGSHMIFKNSEGKRITVPYHSGQILHPKMLKAILEEAELTIEEFEKLR